MKTRLVPAALTVLSTAGLGVALYLIWAHRGGRPIECGGLGDCNFVNNSDYAYFGGVPVSVLGAGLYVVLVALAALWLLRGDDGRVSIAYWGAALSGAAYAAYLTYIELAVLHAICPWCVASATILTVCLAISTWYIVRGDKEPEDGDSTRPRRRARIT